MRFIYQRGRNAKNVTFPLMTVGPAHSLWG